MCIRDRQGIELINQLNQILLSEGKYDELQKASKDKEYQKKLLAEYGPVSYTHLDVYKRQV